MKNPTISHVVGIMENKCLTDSKLEATMISLIFSFNSKENMSNYNSITIQALLWLYFFKYSFIIRIRIDKLIMNS